MADSNGKVSVTKKRKSRQELKNTVIATNPLKDYKNTRTAFWAELIIQGLPPWYLWIGKAMLDSDPLVRFALDIRNAMLMTAEIEVECDNPEIATWIKEQWDFLWTQHGKKVAAAKEFGFAPLQLIWKEDAKNGNLIISDCKEYAPEDAKALVLGNDIKGMKIKGTDVFSPQAMWMTFGSKYDQPYGNGILRRMYPPWFQKWMNHGSERLLQLRMIKDAYIGDIFWYPSNQLVEILNGDGTVTSVPWRDVFRELSENRLSGNTLVLPRLVDDKNNPLTDYTPPQDTGGATSIFDWADRNDNKILQAASITREIIEAASSGSGFSGRSIPFLTTLSVCNEEIKEMIVGFRRPIETAIWLNWGIEPDFTIRPKNLVETFSDDIQGSALGGGAIGGQPSQVGQQPATVITPSGQEVQFAEKKKYVEGIYHADRVDDPDQQKHFHQLVREHGGKSYDLGTGKHLYKLPASSYTISDFHAAAEDAGHNPNHHTLEYNNPGKHALLVHGYTHNSKDSEHSTVDFYNRGASPIHWAEHTITLRKNGSGFTGYGTHSKLPGQYPTGEEHHLRKFLDKAHGKPKLTPITANHQFAEQFIEKVHIKRAYGPDHVVIVHKNLSHDDLHNFAKNTTYKSVRGFTDHTTGDHYYWDADKSIHSQVVHAKGMNKKKLTYHYFDDADVDKHLAERDSKQNIQYEEHSYCSTQFNIPSPLAEEIKALGMQIPDVDLVPTDYGNETKSGREDEIHITCLYGIH